MTLKKQRQRLSKEIRKVTGLPFNETIILARMIVQGSTLASLYSESIRLAGFYLHNTGMVSETRLDALERIEVTYGPDGGFWNGRIVGPRGSFTG